MEGDLTQKVRDSIKKKLHDINCYSDDDLPEYIMVMVANKKSRESMQTDLSLFLDQHAESFTDWLYGMLDNLEKDATKRLEETKDNLNDVSAVLEGDETSKNSEGEVLTLDVQLQDDQSLLKELHEDTSKECSQKEKESAAQSTSSPYRKKAKPVPVIQQKDRKKPVVPEPSNNQQPETKLPKPVCKSTVVKALKRTAADALTDDEYDPLNPGVKSVANVIPAKQRKSSVPLSRQANTMLLLRAVDEANRSISCQLQQQKINEMYKPTPIKILSGPPAAPKPALEMTYGPHEVPKAHQGTFVIEAEISESSSSSEMCADQQVVLSRDTYSPQPYNICIQSFGEPLDYQNADSEDHILKGFIEPPLKPPVSPHFVVTLNGIDGSIYNEVLDFEDMDGSDVENSISISMDAEDDDPASEKLKEKCHFWPACKNGDDCSFHHPSVPCKLFPKCKFADKCRYIHPKCKFDTSCSRSDCHFMHTVKRDFPKMAPGFTVQVVQKAPLSVKPPVTQTAAICKFFPNCSSYKCPFLHPKKCRFGNNCKAKGCPFAHPAFPSRNQLTWTSFA